MYNWYDNGYYADSPGRNPQGPASGQYRVLRGGSLRFYPELVQAASRDRDRPDNRYFYVGFPSGHPRQLTPPQPSLGRCAGGGGCWQMSGVDPLLTSPVPGEGLIGGRVLLVVQPENRREIGSSPNLGEAGWG